MENKQVGWLILGISAVMIIVVLIFNMALKKIVDSACTEGPTCIMYDTIKTQTWISLSIVGIIVIIGLVIMFQKPREKIVVKTIKEKKKPLNLDGLDSDERKVVDILMENNNAIFQAELMEKLGTGKVKITRLLDKLEAKQIIERKRRGMNNIVVLRD
ncbi:hypothetical protein HYT23_06990 [Candidatus Pacearchaeota archaeon]|nr:hypothetical protein [Candidatus Pacearchaeota archaeon]